AHQAAGIFDQYQREVDSALANAATSAFTRLPEAFERLSAGSPEAISHALTTCRRVIDSFADSVFPPRDGFFAIGEQQIEIGASHTRNRLRAYVYGCIGRGSRYERINRCLGSLYDRVSTGVHSDVSISEARALVLQTYLFLGEILSIT